MQTMLWSLIEEKRCRTCDELKSLDEFYRAPEMRDGRSNQCKACQSEYYRNYAAANRSRIAELQADWYDRNSERVKTRQRSYYADHRDTQLERIREWKQRNPNKTRAHSVVNNAVMRGKLQRQPCESCGDASTEAHHDDYSRPLDVRWLCRTCHARHHAQLRRSIRRSAI